MQNQGSRPLLCLLSCRQGWQEYCKERLCNCFQACYRPVQAAVFWSLKLLQLPRRPPQMHCRQAQHRMSFDAFPLHGSILTTGVERLLPCRKHIKPSRLFSSLTEVSRGALAGIVPQQFLLVMIFCPPAETGGPQALGLVISQKLSLPSHRLPPGQKDGPLPP